ncbi:MAG: PAC2 family protein [Candidatus Lokiarchaeota archaeon]|nr:PAC2 family protein [Candidatus Lokiarchaeota archaeon]
MDKKFEIDPDILENTIVLVGWPGIALVGKLAIGSIKDSIEAQLFLNIDFFDFPPKSNVEKGSLEIPSARLYYKARSDTNKQNDIFILTGDYQPQSAEGVFEFSKKFCDTLNDITRNHVTMYVSTAALVTNIAHDPPHIHVCGTHPDIVESFTKFENTVEMKNGVISGANGILPAWAGLRANVPGICLLAETIPLPMMNLDPKASKSLASLLSNYFGIKTDLSNIDKKIEELEAIFESFEGDINPPISDDDEGLGSDSYFR